MGRIFQRNVFLITLEMPLAFLLIMSRVISFKFMAKLAQCYNTSAVGFILPCVINNVVFSLCDIMTLLEI